MKNTTQMKKAKNTHEFELAENESEFEPMIEKMSKI